MVTVAAAAPPITVDQYLAFEGYPGLRDELINGRIVLSPQPKPLHQQIVENLIKLLERSLEGSLYTVKQNSNIRFDQAHSMPAPDVFVVTGRAWQTAIETDTYLSEPPLIVAEVLSPANRRKQVDEKIVLYFRNGVRHVWIADPKKHQVYRASISPTGQPVKEPFDQITVEEPVRFTLHASRILALPFSSRLA